MAVACPSADGVWGGGVSADGELFGGFGGGEESYCAPSPVLLWCAVASPDGTLDVLGLVAEEFEEVVGCGELVGDGAGVVGDEGGEAVAVFGLDGFVVDVALGVDDHVEQSAGGFVVGVVVVALVYQQQFDVECPVVIWFG